MESWGKKGKNPEKITEAGYNTNKSVSGRGVMNYDSKPSQLQTSEIERNSLHASIDSLQSINSNTLCMWETVLLMK